MKLPTLARVAVAATVLVGTISLAGSSPAAGSAALTVKMVTWDVIGLDSNLLSSGPDTFPVSARVCNEGGTSAATDVTATFKWDSSNAYISLAGPATQSVDSIPIDGCVDFSFNVVVARDELAFDTTRGYHIEIATGGVTTLSTATPRQLFVRRLVSQNRNEVATITGQDGGPAPTSLFVGETYIYELHGKTATNGYEQLEVFLTFPDTIFRIESIDATYTGPTGGTNDAVYADACGWDPDPSSATYLTCIGPTQYGGKAGGAIVLRYAVSVHNVGSADLEGLIYDFSGNSYHYNADFGTDTVTVTVDRRLTTTTSSPTTVVPLTTVPSTMPPPATVESTSPSPLDVTLPSTGPGVPSSDIAAYSAFCILLGAGLLFLVRRPRW